MLRVDSTLFQSLDLGMDKDNVDYLDDVTGR